MSDLYESEAGSTKSLDIKDLPGLPADISPSFNQCCIRFYESEEMKGYFYCTLAIPSVTDEDGYVLEEEFLESSREDPNTNMPETYVERKYDPEEDAWVDTSPYESEAEWGGGGWEPYSAPLNERTVASLPDHVSCHFEESRERNRRDLLLHLEVKGTPYAGFAVIHRDLYSESSH